MNQNLATLIPGHMLKLMMFQRSPGGHQFVLMARLANHPDLPSLDRALASVESAKLEGSLTTGEATLRFSNLNDAAAFHDYLNESQVAQYTAPQGFGPELVKGPGETCVFICHASENRLEARSLSGALNAAGIATFIDTDDIKADASFVARLNEALNSCTHFIALLSPISSKKKWPRHEVLSITSKVVDKEVSFFPIALGGYSTTDFRKDFITLAHISLRSSSGITDLIPQLVKDILSISKKPLLAELPKVAPE